MIISLVFAAVCMLSDLGRGRLKTLDSSASISTSMHRIELSGSLVAFHWIKDAE